MSQRSPQAKKAHRGLATTHGSTKFWLGEDVIAEAKAEADRLGISLSEIFRQAWRIAKPVFERVPPGVPTRAQTRAA